MTTATETTRKLPLSEFPSALHDEIAERLALSSVGVTAIKRGADDTTYPTEHGSGTLVRVAGRLAILTADHVARPLDDADLMSVLVDWSGGVRRCHYERNHLVFAHLARGTGDGNGPDMALVFLPEAGEASQTLRTHKVFYDLDRRIASLPGRYPELDRGFWFTCGVPGEGATNVGPVHNFESVRGVHGLCAIATRPQEVEHAGFDYYDQRVPVVGTDVPSRLNGLSGGGLWQVTIRQAADGTLYAEEYILAGVAFYEWHDPERRMRSHGRRSLHERLPELLRASLGWEAPPPAVVPLPEA
jgi:hypothetical protein